MRRALRRLIPQSARVFEEMAPEEDEHRDPPIDAHRRRFGEVIPLLRREHVAGFYHRRPVWLIETLGPDPIRDEAARMELEARDFYLRPPSARPTPARGSCSAAWRPPNRDTRRPARVSFANISRRRRPPPRVPKRTGNSS